MLFNLEVTIPKNHQDTSMNCHKVDTYKESNHIDSSIPTTLHYPPINNPMTLPLTPRNSPVKCHPEETMRERIEPYQKKNETLKPFLPLTMPSTTPKVKANRFTDAQRDRTLRHHKLIQPTPVQERVHLSSLNKHVHLSSLSGVQRMSSSDLSLLSLPESDEGEDEEVVHLDLNHLSGTTKPSTESSISDHSASSFTSEGDAYSEVSPTTTLFVPGQPYGQMEDHNSKKNVTPEFDGPSSFNSGSTDCTAPTNVSSNPTMYPFCQPCEMEPNSLSHRFVVAADTQFGITKNNESWQAEMEYSVSAVKLINSMNPRPSFVCVCGDLVDMEFTFEKKKGSKSKL